MTLDAIRLRCTNFVDATSDGLRWLAEPANSERVGQAQHAMTRDIRRIRRRAEKLARAVDRNNAVSVFGPSQAGKSFLVSVLARPKGARLLADYAGEGNRLDYISDINPEGEGESTGLVTRFTVNRSATPPGFPIKLTILSESDVIRTLCNSFYLDGDNSEDVPSSEALGQLIDRFAPLGRSPGPGLTAEDVWEIQEYTEKHFRRFAYAENLKTFWDRAAEIAPNLSRKDRGAFLAVLWGNHPAITDLYTRLTAVLDQLGHAETLHAKTDALVPKVNSIIDVAMLKQLADDSASAARITIRSANKEVSIRKVDLCALTAELELPMLARPHDFMEHTDLLDFPGARNRFEKPLVESLKEPAQGLPEMFLRGKVSYLFDNYVAHQEITSMLLCLPPSNQEITALPGLIDGWIAGTIGSDPKRRADADNILFVVLTKFDTHLVDTAASDGLTTRFDKRIEKSLLEKFGKQRDKWVDNWGPNAPFRNCYWLRNPYYPAEAFFSYDQNKIETTRDDKKDRVAALREGCLLADNVQRHVAGPAQAWDAAMTPNDGGVTYLVEAMTKVCRPDTKPRQITAQVDLFAAQFLSILRPYHVSDDLDAQLAAKIAEVDRVIPALEQALDGGTFGEVIAALSVSQDAVRAAISQVPNHIRVSANGRPSPETTANPAGPRWTRGRGAEAPAAPTAAPATRMLSRETYMATKALEMWSDQLVELREASGDLLGLNGDDAWVIASEIQKAVMRQGLLQAMILRLKEVSFGLTLDEEIPAAAILCCEEINQFVATFGLGRVPLADRPAVTDASGRDIKVFAPKPQIDDAGGLSAIPSNTAEDYWRQWVAAFDFVAQKNVMAQGGSNVDTTQNVALRRILDLASGAAA